MTACGTCLVDTDTLVSKPSNNIIHSLATYSELLRSCSLLVIVSLHKLYLGSVLVHGTKD